MDQVTFTNFVVTVVLTALVLRLANHFLGPKYDSREPPLVSQKVPYLGHLIGLIQHGLMYIENLRYLSSADFQDNHADFFCSAKHPLPAFTLQTLTRRTYIVVDPDLISAVQKNAKALTFHPFVSFMSKRLFDADERAMAAISENLDGEQGSYGLLPEVARYMHNTLAPGTSLDWMVETMLTKMMGFFDRLENSQCGNVVNLYQ